MPIEINFDDLFQQLKDGITGLAKSTVKKYVNEAKDDGKSLLESMKDKLQRWTKLLINGDLTTSDFEWLVNSQKDLVQMTALKQAGLAAIRIDQFKNSVLNLVVDTIFSAIKI